MSARTKLVVGLGNPGRDYSGTRHNIGFAVLDRFAEKCGGAFRKRFRFAAEVAEANLGDARLLLAKPQTFMNRSGVAVNTLLQWLKIAPAELLVVVDDADLPLGQLRLRSSGGSGGHNGLRSIIESLGGNEEFARLRVGIGRRGPVGEDITGHVLGKFSASECELAGQATDAAVDAIECASREGIAMAMNQFNRRKEETC